MLRRQSLLFSYAVATLAGTIIGVGLFSLPYVTLRVGWGVMLTYFIVMGFFVWLIHKFFAELALITPDHKRLPGFVKYYLGAKWAKISRFTHSLALLGAVIAYIIVGGEFLYTLLANKLGGSVTTYTLIYLSAGAFIFLIGIKAIEKIQVFGLVAFLFILLGVIWLGRAEFSLFNLTARSFESANWFLPYGVVMFSLWGVSLIPQIEEMLGKNKKVLLRVVGISIILPALIYLIFTAAILAISGSETSTSALPGLAQKVGNGIEIPLLIFGLITTFTSYIALGLTLRQVLEFDFSLRRDWSWSITVLVPLTLYYLGVRNFIELIAFVGAVMLAVDGIFIMVMYQRHVLTTSWKIIMSRVLLIILAGGIIYELWNLTNLIG